MTSMFRFTKKEIEGLRTMDNGTGVSKRAFVNYFVQKHDVTIDTADPRMFCLLENIFDSFDTGKKNCLTFEQLLQELDRIWNGTAEEFLHSVFKICDVTGKRKIEKHHLTAFFQSLSFAPVYTVCTTAAPHASVHQDAACVQARVKKTHKQKHKYTVQDVEMRGDGQEANRTVQITQTKQYVEEQAVQAVCLAVPSTEQSNEAQQLLTDKEVERILRNPSYNEDEFVKVLKTHGTLINKISRAVKHLLQI